MKTIGAAFQTHLNGEVTTTCFLWKITRKDGVSEYYTEHDKALTFEGQSYSPVNTAFSPTAITQSGELNVDNLEVDVILGGVDKTALLAGKYDAADVYFYLVNWQDTTQSVKITRGKFGEVVVENGKARIELRGLMQALQQPMLKVTSPTCRADFGDTKCAVNLAPLTVTGTTDNPFTFEDFSAYTVGTWPSTWTKRFTPFHPASNSKIVTLAGSISGKALNMEGSPGVQVGTSCDMLDSKTSFELLTYYDPVDIGMIQNLHLALDASGTYAARTGYFFTAPANNRYDLWRYVGGVGVNTGAWMPVTGIDGFGGGSNIAVRVRYWMDGGSRRIQARQWVYGQTEPSTWPVDYTDPTPLANGWKGFFMTSWLQARVRYYSVSDHYSVSVPATPAAAPPAVKASFIDIDRAEANDYWNEGKVTFTSGSNSGFSMEVKDWDLVNRKVSLWEPMPFAIEPGTTYSMTPGCQKTLAACIAYNNVLNFRGEPHLPGQDVLTQSPNYSEQTQ